MSTTAYPVHVRGDLQAGLSRWLWLVKWLLAIPHYVILAFLWVAFVVLSVLAFFAILFTGRYPRVLFEFNVGVLRWWWRVTYYAYGALGTDRYPPFTLHEVPSYPAHLDVDYPEHLSRGLVLVKWWLLAIPHYVVLGFFVGGGVWASNHLSSPDGGLWLVGGGLIGLLVVVAAVSLLFTGSYPQGLFDLVLGLNRWVLRVAGYAALMTDRYPPFRLDLGGGEDAGGGRLTLDPRSPAPASSVPTSPPSGVPAVERQEHDPRTGPHWSAGRVVGAVLGSLAVVAGVSLAGAGAVLAVVDHGLRDQDGYLTSSPVALETRGYAIASQGLQLHSPNGMGNVPFRLLGKTRITVTPVDEPVFVGIARTADAEALLQGVRHATLTDVVVPGDGNDRVPVYRDTPGGRPRGLPTEAKIWVAQASGTGRLTVGWAPEDGDWTVVVMGADSRAGVDVVATAGATLPVLSTAVWILVGVGVVVLVAGALTLVLVLRPRRSSG